MTNEQIKAMATWTLEDFQDDALGAVEQVRKLAASHMAMQRERDAAVRDLKEYGTARGFTCEVCTHKRGTKYTPCFYPNGVDVDDNMCRSCGRCKCGHCDGVSQWEWRGMQKEART